jgi:hypothetical protein
MPSTQSVLSSVLLPIEKYRTLRRICTRYCVLCVVLYIEDYRKYRTLRENQILK